MKYYKRVPLRCAENVRDLGGYLTCDGKLTNWRVFLRSEAIDKITEKDAAFLYDYGIRTVIDLRLPSEFEKTNTQYLINTLAMSKISHRSIPLIDSYGDINTHFYIHMLENGKKNIRQIFEYIGARLNYGGILYNCFAGKDRTGVLSALLLLLCGVSELDVLGDYMISSVYLKPLADKLGLAVDFRRSDPDLMEEFLIYLRNKSSSAEQYLHSIGVSANIILFIRNKLIG